MRRSIFLQLALLLGFSATFPCCTKDKGVSIEGDWVYVNKRYNDVDHYAGIQLNKDTFYRLSDQGRTKVGQYRIVNDSLNIAISNSLYSQPRLEYETYLIKALSHDSLTLISSNGYELNYYDRKLDYDTNLRLDSIYLRAGTCFGKCPEFEFTLARNSGEANFIGGNNSKLKGEHKFKFTNSELNRLDSLFKWTRIQQYDSTLYYGAIDDWMIELKINYNEGEFRKIRGSYGGLLYRLQPLTREIIEKLKKEGAI